jgi:hypothetical protein
MPCPPQIAEAVLSILSLGLLRIRAAAWAGNTERCAWEADHLHDLPGLLSQYSPEKLSFYWEVAREEFLTNCRGAGLATSEFEAAWVLMQRQLEAAA